MGENQESSFFGKLFYICGNSNNNNSEISGTLKEKLIVDLATRCFVRTHASPIDDLIDTYCAILSSHAFIFTLNSQSLSDIDCLNQLGIAISYGIPVVTVRESDYNLPKALPMRFYETKIVNRKSQLRPNKNKLAVAENSTPITLASALTSCYGNSFAYTLASYSTFFDQLLNCLKSLSYDQSYGNASESSMSEEEEMANSLEKYGEKTSKPIQITGVSKAKINRTNKTQQSKKSKALSDVYGLESNKLLNNRKQASSHKKFNVSHVLPNRTKSPTTKSQRKSESPQRQSSGNRNVDKNENKAKLNATNVNLNGVTKKDDNETKSPKGYTVNIRHIPSSPTIPADLPQQNVQQSENKNELALPNRGKNRRQLRRVSSLPVVPTQYLVASDSSCSSPKIHCYPPAPMSSSHLMARSDSMFYLSGDESDYCAVNLSRTCSPDDNFEPLIHSYSTDDSSR